MDVSNGVHNRFLAQRRVGKDLMTRVVEEG